MIHVVQSMLGESEWQQPGTAGCFTEQGKQREDKGRFILFIQPIPSLQSAPPRSEPVKIISHRHFQGLRSKVILGLIKMTIEIEHHTWFYELEDTYDQ